MYGDMGTKKGPKPTKTAADSGKNGSKLTGKSVALNGAWLDGRLSPKELEVFHLLGRGHSLKEISALLGIGYFTVTTHQHRIQHKLDLPNQRHLLVTAIRHGAGLSQL